MNDSRTISGTVHVASDSGSPERIALELCWRVANVEKVGGDGNYRKQVLDIYAECLQAARGYRNVA